MEKKSCCIGFSLAESVGLGEECKELDLHRVYIHNIEEISLFYFFHGIN